MLQSLVRGVKTAYQKTVDAASTVALAVVGAVSGLLATANDAMAALPASVGTSITAIETDGTAIFDLVFPVIAAFTGLVIVIKLFKRFSNKI